jgi:hypothetical protein
MSIRIGHSRRGLAGARGRRAVIAPIIALLAFLAPAPLARAQQEQAAELFRRGVEAARAERWVAARRSFERAYELLPRPEILINLAAAQAQTDGLVEAQRGYRELVGSADIDPRLREEAQRALVELDREIPRARINIEGLRPGHRVALDDVAVAPSSLASEISVNPGPHTLVVTYEDEIVARAEFSAERGRSVTVPMTITHTPAVGRAADEPTPLASAGADPTLQLAVGSILTAAGVALGVVDFVSIGLEGSCAEGTAGACSQVWAFEEGAMIGYAVAGVASLATGVAFLIWGATMSGSRAQPHGGVGLRGGDLVFSF